MNQHQEVTTTMRTSVGEAWSIVSDITRIGEFSPETFEAEWLGDATGPAVGSRFRGHVRRNEVGPTYWTTCTVLDCEPERLFVFGVGSAKNPLTRWGYRLTPQRDGCIEVTETFDFSTAWWAQPYWLVFGGLRRRRIARDMARTLKNMRSVVER